MTDEVLKEQTLQAARALEELIPPLGFHPAPMTLALLALGVTYSYSSGIITREDLLTQVAVFWDQHHKTLN